MAVSTRSLLDYLRSENPPLNSKKCKSKKNTESKKSWISPRWIQTWEDFEFDSLRSIYGGALRKVLEHQFVLRDFSGIPQYPFCEIHDEDSLESLLARWNHCVVSDALSKSQDHLSRSFSTLKEVYMVRGGQAQYPGFDASYRPDWGAVQPSIHPGKPSTILPGDTKLSEKWGSDKIKRGPAKITFMKEEWFRPLAQLYTYCVKANARYGYIITDKELVVTRVKPMPPNKSQAVQRMQTSSDSIPADRALESGMLEYKSIPWKNNYNTQLSDPRAMTVNLGLWWLHIMAAEKRSIENVYRPLREVIWDIEARGGDRVFAAFAFSEMSDLRQELSDVTNRRGNHTGMKRVRIDEPDFDRDDQIKRQRRG